MAITIQDFYKQALEALRFQVDDDDLISFLNPEGRPQPTVVDGRRLVMPSKARLRQGFGEELQPFHPLSENIARRSASPVLKTVQRTAKAVLAHYFTELSLRLLAVASDPTLHKDLPPVCSEYLTKVPNADKKMLKVFEQLIGKAVQKNKLITLYMRNGGTLDGKKYNRLCVIRFPIMDELNNEHPFDLKVRKKDRETLQALLHHVMPFGDSPEEYSAGSNSRMAPFFDAFLQAYAKAATQLNHVVHKYAKPLDIDLDPIPLDYQEHLDNLGKFYEKIPALRGNDGDSAEEDVEASETVTKPAEAKAVKTQQGNDVPPWEEQPKPVSKPAAPVDKGGMSIDDFMNTINPQRPPQQPNPYAAPTQSNPYSQQPSYGMPQQPNYPQPPNQGYPPQGYPQQQNFGGYGGYGGGGYGGNPGDPRRPGWLVGGSGGGAQPPQPPANPFAEAVMTQSAPVERRGYGATYPQQGPGGYPPQPNQGYPPQGGYGGGAL